MMAAFPDYVRLLLDLVKSWTFDASFRAPATLGELAEEAPALGRALDQCPSAEIDLILRALGEAEAIMHYDRCDARLAGEQTSPALSRRVFLRSLEQRLRKAYDRYNSVSGVADG